MRSPFAATRWVLFSSFGFRLISLGGQMLILRHVDKDVFGAYRALVGIHLILLVALPLSFDTLVIREKSRRARYAMALSIVLAMIGITIASSALLLALLPMPTSGSFLSRLLEMGNAYPALYFMPAIFLVQAFKLSIRSLLTADLNLRKISIGEFGNGLITWLGGAAVVLLYPTAWALMAAYLVGEIFECWFMYRGERWRLASMIAPKRWRVLWKLLHRHRAYCLFNTGNIGFNQLASLLPGVLIVALISKSANADFAVAQQLLVLPTMLLVGALWRVAFPSLSGVPEEELQSRCLRIISGSAAYIAPGVFWFAVFAPTTVYILGGEQYLETVPPLSRWMATYMLFAAVFSPISSIDMIRDRPDVGLYWNLAYSIGRVLIIVHFAPQGLYPTIVALSLFSVVMWVFHVWIWMWLIRCGWARFLKSFVPFVPFWALLAGGYVLCLYAGGGGLLWPAVLSIVPSLIYLGLMMKFFPQEGALIRRFVRA